MMRLIAALALFIPGLISAYGIKLMRDTLFSDFNPLFINLGIQFTIGFILFGVGVTFIGGFIVHRDRKRNLVQKRKDS